jgi:PEP-CTERM motif
MWIWHHTVEGHPKTEELRKVYCMSKSISLSTRVFSQIKIILAVAGTVTAMELAETQAKAAAALWISAPTWSYSAALAQSPVGTAYFWGLSVGVGSYSYAYAFSNDGLGDAGYAYAQAAAGRGGRGAFLASGFADPWGGDAIDSALIDPSNPALYPTTDPGSDDWAVPYDISNSGMTLSETGNELSGDFQLEAFVYDGASDMASLEAELGASSSSGTSAAGDVTDFTTLEHDFSLIPLDSALDDPSSLSSLTFTENGNDIHGNYDNVILVGMSEGTSTPEPGTLALTGIGLAGLMIFRKVRAAKVA